RLQRQQFLLSRLTQSLLNYLNVIKQLHRLAVADVIDLPRSAAAGRIRRQARPLRIALGDTSQRQQHTTDNIVDIGEITTMFTVIEHLQRLALQNRTSKQNR